MGSTGSGKSETLKGIFYNSLCWGSGFFCADGKADNKLPTDGFTMARAFARDDDILALNFLLGGKTPQQVAKARRRRSNRLNPFSSGDADTLIQMGANLLPKAEGEGKSWQEKALVLWRAVITALCYKRDNQEFTLSVGKIIDYLSLTKAEELYVEGYREAKESETGEEWSYGFASIKNYFEAGLPAYSIDKLLKKHGLGDAPPQARSPGMKAHAAPGREVEQDPAALEQHGYRTGQLMPILNLLDKTYGYIFRAPFPEIDMTDVALRNRILFLLIPSLEKSSQEAENLGKLAIACLRVMMARNLGAELEGSREELLESKATTSLYPYIVALDELGYYFADGIAVMFAQARSLGLSLIAAAQDLEKLTEGSRKAEAGAMIGNTVNKIFMKIDDPEQTYKLVSSTVGKINVASYDGFAAGEGAGGFKRNQGLRVSEVDLITYQEMQKYTEGQAIMNALGVTQRISTFYLGDWLDKLGNKSFHINRFLQVFEPNDEDIERYTIEVPTAKSETALPNSQKLMDILRNTRPLGPRVPTPLFAELARVISVLNKEASGIDAIERGLVLYLAMKRFISSGTVMAQAPAIEVPASVAILANEDAMGLAQSLDEHGLPDPLSLLRKPITEIISPVEEMPVRRPLGVPTNVAVFRNEEMTLASRTREELPEFSFGYGVDQTHDQIDQMINEGRRPPRNESSPAEWVSKAVSEAKAMEHTPRSADRTAIGLSSDTLRELEGLEQSLGSTQPKQTAHVMEQVVSATITPNTIGSGSVSDEEIEDFFRALVDASSDE